MKITPSVIEQNKSVDYKVSLKDTSNIESIEVLSRGNYYHKDTLKYTIQNSTILFSHKMLYLVNL